MNVTLVTTWGTACGIAEHAAYLKAALEGAMEDLVVTIQPDLHPRAVLEGIDWSRQVPDWVWLNYHAALHSQWTAADVVQAQARGSRVGITYHDSGVPNSEQCRLLHQVADAFVVHEPCEDLPGAHYIRQGVPDWSPVWQFGDRRAVYGEDCFRRDWAQPIVGTVGFPFPWKNYDLLAEASAAAGWALLLIAPGASPAQVDGWRRRNPDSYVHTGFLPEYRVRALLAGCDATAFLYACANTGTSGAIRQGIAARKPVVATSANGCRQFRDLMEDKVARYAIDWLADLSVDTVVGTLSTLEIGRVAPAIVRLAEQDSWARVGARYAEILRAGSSR